MLKNMTKAVFDENINTKFCVNAENGESVELELVKVVEKKTAVVETISLIFKGTDENILNDNTYTFEHDEMGLFKLFISPYMHKEDSIYYDVIISKLIDNETV